MLVSGKGNSSDKHHLISTETGTIRSFAFFGAEIMARPFARRFYSSKTWQDCRNAYSKSVHHLCENCLKLGIYRPGEIVHHKIEMDPVTIENPELALGFGNLELLCRECHAKMHDARTKNNRFIIGDDGRVVAR